MTATNESERLHCYLAGWDAATRCIWRSFIGVPEEHWAVIIRCHIEALRPESDA